MVSNIATVAGIVAGVSGAAHMRLLYIVTTTLFGRAACLYPSSLSMIKDYMDSGDPIAASAGLLLAYGVGTCIGPVAAVFWRGFTTPSVSVADQSRFVTIVTANTSSAILELDPRHELYMETPHVFDELHAVPGPAQAFAEEAPESPSKADLPGI